jgi:L-lactate dehydrogenase complex protein LldG
VLARVRKALDRVGARPAAPDGDRRRAATAYIDEHRQGPRPHVPAALVAHFMQRATDMASTLDRVDAPEEIPGAVARYLDALVLPPAVAAQRTRRGVCWPELALLDWRAAGLDIEARPATGSDRLAVTGAFCAIAETGTLVFLSGADTPTGATLLPDTHVAVVRADRIVTGMEDAFALVRAERGSAPRAINLISGPSRTGDIEQTIVLGAHGPFRLHVVVLG